MKATTHHKSLIFKLLLLSSIGYSMSCSAESDIRLFDTVKPIPVYQAAKMSSNNFDFATYLEPNTPCSLIAARFNAIESPNYTYHNPQGYVHPAWGLGCKFDMYIRQAWAGWAAGTVRDDYRQNWVLATHVCPQGYSLNSAGLCQMVVPTAAPLCYKNPILLGDGAKFQVLNFGGTSFERIGFQLTYRSNPYFRKEDNYRSMYGQINWSDNSGGRLLFSRVENGQYHVYFYEGPSALYVFEVDGDVVVSRNDESKMLQKSNNEWVLTDYKRNKKMHFDAKGLLTSFGAIGDGELNQIVRFEKDLTYQTAVPLGRAESFLSSFGAVTYEYGHDGFVGKVKSDGGEYLRFAYNGPDLIEAIFLGNETVPNLEEIAMYRFEYKQDNLSLLTSIIDSSGQHYANWEYDAAGRAIRTYHGSQMETGVVDYQKINVSPISTVKTTNEFGKTTSYNFLAINGIKRLSSVEGHASDNCAAANKSYTYYPNGTLKSKTDWSGNITSYVRDEFGREISRTEASGTPEARTVLTEYHPTLNQPVKITEPGLITEMTYDPAGRLLNTKKTATAQ